MQMQILWLQYVGSNLRILLNFLIEILLNCLIVSELISYDFSVSLDPHPNEPTYVDCLSVSRQLALLQNLIYIGLILLWQPSAEPQSED